MTPITDIAARVTEAVTIDGFAAAKVGLLHGRLSIDDTRPGCIVVDCPNATHPVCEQHECCELCQNPFAQHCFVDDFGGPNSRTLVRAMYAAAFESNPGATFEALWRSIDGRYPSVASWARKVVADAFVSTDVSDKSLVVHNTLFVDIVQPLAGYLRADRDDDADEKEGEPAYVSKHHIIADRLEAAVSQFCADPLGRPLLVGRNFKHMPDNKWSHVCNQKLKFELHHESGDLLLISCAADPPHSAAVFELGRQVGNFVAFHDLSTHLLCTSDGKGEFVAGQTNAPDVSISHLPAGAGGVVRTSLVIEVEVGNRSGPQLIQQLRAYAQAPVCAYLLGITIYQRNPAGNWAGAAVLWRANAAQMVGAWSFGPRDVTQMDKARYRAGAPPALASATAAQLPFAHVAAGPLTITVPATDIVSNHAQQPALNAAIQAAVAAGVVAPGFVAGQLTIDLESLRDVVQSTLP